MMHGGWGYQSQQNITLLSLQQLGHKITCWEKVFCTQTFHLTSLNIVNSTADSQTDWLNFHTLPNMVQPYSRFDLVLSDLGLFLFWKKSIQQLIKYIGMYMINYLSVLFAKPLSSLWFLQGKWCTMSMTAMGGVILDIAMRLVKLIPVPIHVPQRQHQAQPVPHFQAQFLLSQLLPHLLLHLVPLLHLQLPWTAIMWIHQER